MVKVIRRYISRNDVIIHVFTCMQTDLGVIYCTTTEG